MPKVCCCSRSTIQYKRGISLHCMLLQIDGNCGHKLAFLFQELGIFIDQAAEIEGSCNMSAYMPTFFLTLIPAYDICSLSGILFYFIFIPFIFWLVPEEMESYTHVANMNIHSNLIRFSHLCRWGKSKK